MNKSYSPSVEYLPRWIAPILRRSLSESDIIVLSGARQVGKSTLLLNEEPFNQWKFYTLDDFDTLAQAKDDPESLWAGSDRVVLDEVQKAPDLLTAVKKAVDLHPNRYRFILSGSANLLLMKQVSETLAGRAIYFILHPLTIGEMNRLSPPTLLTQLLNQEYPEEKRLKVELPNPVPLMLRGFMPALLRRDTVDSQVRWWDGYVATYLERDLRQISQIDSLLDFRRLMELLALRSGQLINQSEIGRDAGISQPTAHRYINILETTHLFERLPPYLTSRSSRIIKSPKAYWGDPGLAVFLSGYYQTDELEKARECGSYFETMIYHHLRVLVDLMTPPGRLSFWRTLGGGEVDFVLEHGRRALAIEVKRSARPSFGDTAALRAFLKDHPQVSGGLLLHGGTEIRRVTENIIAVPWTMITGE